MKNVISGAQFHKFETSPKIVGRFIKDVIREKDGDDEGQRAGSVMGYLFHDLVNEEDVIVGASSQIEKARETFKTDDVVLIEFLGKTTNKKNQPVNRFRVDVAENEADVKMLLGESGT